MSRRAYRHEHGDEWSVYVIDGTQWVQVAPWGQAGWQQQPPPFTDAAAFLEHCHQNAWEKPHTWIESDLHPGQYFPLMWQKTFSPSLYETPQLLPFGVHMARNLKMLLRDFFTLTEAIEPTPQNFSAFGQKARHLLIVVCTEIEAVWRQILVENGYVSPRMTTNDYVKLEPILGLASWSVRVLRFTNLPAVQPFLGWSSANPTTSLAWYDAYNACKHDSVGSLPRANLKSVADAVLALFTMSCAAFGPDFVRSSLGELGDEIVSSVPPTWPLARRVITPIAGETWSTTKFPF